MNENEVIKYLIEWFKLNKDHPRKWSNNKIGRLIKSELSKTNNFKCKSRSGSAAGYEASKNKLKEHQFTKTLDKQNKSKSNKGNNQLPYFPMIDDEPPNDDTYRRNHLGFVEREDGSYHCGFGWMK